MPFTLIYSTPPLISSDIQSDHFNLSLPTVDLFSESNPSGQDPFDMFLLQQTMWAQLQHARSAGTNVAIGSR